MPLPKSKAALFSGAELERLFTTLHFVVATFIFGQVVTTSIVITYKEEKRIIISEGNQHRLARLGRK